MSSQDYDIESQNDEVESQNGDIESQDDDSESQDDNQDDDQDNDIECKYCGEKCIFDNWQINRGLFLTIILPKFSAEGKT
ncbi:hypothetical protein RhiirC2_804542, partial [Rhizophagus irregularis]